MQEGRAQRYGTQWFDDPVDGRIRPWMLTDPEHVDEFRAEVGLKPIHPTPDRGPDPPAEEQQAIKDNQQWWEQWFIHKGWCS